MTIFSNSLILLGILLIPAAFVIRLIIFFLSILVNKFGVVAPLRNLIEIVGVNLLRLTSGGLVLYFWGLSIQMVATIIASIVLVVIIGSVITGLAGDIITNILLVKQVDLRPGLRLKINPFHETTSKVIVVKELDLLNLQGILEDHTIEIIPYWHLRQIGFQIIQDEK